MTTAIDQLPVIIGVAAVSNRGDVTREPLDLITEAAAAALDDGNVPAGAELASVDEVFVVSWVYENLAAQVAERLGHTARSALRTPIGGDQPTRAVAAAGRRAAADGGIHLVVGGETIRSLTRAMTTGEVSAWGPGVPGAVAVDPRDHVTDEAMLHGLMPPSAVYPLYEHGLRARLGQRREEATAWSAAMWAEMSATAARNPAAWFTEPVDAARVRTADASNRMIYDPYPKLMNALLSVDQAAAAVVTTVATARRLGLPDERLVHLWAEAGAVDSKDVLARVGYDRAPAMERVLDDALAAAGVAGRDDLSLVEIYSCFPCVPKLALTHLGWAADSPLSVTGGLTFFGGAGNAYMLAAVAAMTDALRSGADERPALLYGQGEFVTKHHALVVGRTPRPGGPLPPDDEPARQALVDAEPRPDRVRYPDGPATIETFTVEYDRSGAPGTAIVVGRLDDGRRFVAQDRDPDDVAALLVDDPEPVGRPGLAAPGTETEPNRFTLK